jgi:hypothetical protein
MIDHLNSVKSNPVQEREEGEREWKRERETERRREIKRVTLSL